MSESANNKTKRFDEIDDSGFTEPMQAPSSEVTKVLDQIDETQPPIGGRAVKAIVAGLACVAVAVGLGLTLGNNNASRAGAQNTTNQVATQKEDVSSTSTKRDVKDVSDILSEISKLRFGEADQDVSIPADQARVEVSDGHVQVTQVSTDDAATMVELTAKRSAALAKALSDTDLKGNDENSTQEVTDVTWLATNQDGTVQVAISYDPSSVPDVEDAAALVNDAVGHAMTDEAFASVKDKGVTQNGGETPKLLNGTQIIPGETNVPTPTEKPTVTPTTQTQPENANATTDKPADQAQQSPSATQTSTNASANAPASPSPSQPSDTQPSQPAQPAQKSGHYEPVYETQPVYETRPVYAEEPVYETKVVYVCSDGFTSTSASEVRAHSIEVEGSYHAREEQVQVGTRTVQVGTEQVQVGTQQVQVGERWVED